MSEKYKKPVGEMLPLTEKKRVILTILSDNPSHGYGIMKTAKGQFNMRLPTGSLYRTIAALLDARLIAECAPPASLPIAERVGKMPRQYYMMTGMGERVLYADWEARASLNEAQRRVVMGGRS